VGEGTLAQRGLAISGTALISAVTAWGALGTVCEWRGFREEEDEELDEDESPEEHRLWDPEIDPRPKR
jgi:hypothetical protein